MGLELLRRDQEKEQRGEGVIEDMMEQETLDWIRNNKTRRSREKELQKGTVDGSWRFL